MLMAIRTRNNKIMTTNTNNMGSVSQLLLMAEIFGLTSFLNFFPEIAYIVSLSFVTKYFAKIQFSPALDL